MRSDGIATALGHLFALAGLVVLHHEEAMGKDVLRNGLAYGHEHGGPDDAVEADDVLAHHVVLRRPATGVLVGHLGVAEAHRRGIVEQRVKPHVGDVLVIKWHGNAPVEACATH